MYCLTPKSLYILAKNLPSNSGLSSTLSVLKSAIKPDILVETLPEVEVKSKSEPNLPSIVSLVAVPELASPVVTFNIL